MKKLLAVLAAVSAALSAPSVAYAVSVSSNDGSGTQSVSVWLRCGADMVGKLRSTHGDPVYYNGDEVIDNAIDIGVGRYTTDTTSTSYVSKGGTIGSNNCTANPIDGIHVKVCRNKSFFPDPCGSWAPVIRRP